MFRYLFSLFQACLLVGCASLLYLVAVAPSLAQDEGLTFEQAQIRTSYARKQMDSLQKKLKDAEAKEKTALREADELKKRYEKAQKEADKATQTRESVEEQYKNASATWLDEAERLKRIHERLDSPLPSR